MAPFCIALVVVLLVVAHAAHHYFVLTTGNAKRLQVALEDLDIERRNREWERGAARDRHDRAVDALQKEGQRLTNVIIQLRAEKGWTLPPEASDERWGAYTITPEMELAEMERRRRRETEEDDEMRAAENELLAQIGESLG